MLLLLLVVVAVALVLWWWWWCWWLLLVLILLLPAGPAGRATTAGSPASAASALLSRYKFAPSFQQAHMLPLLTCGVCRLRPAQLPLKRRPLPAQAPRRLHSPLDRRRRGGVQLLVQHRALGRQLAELGRQHPHPQRRQHLQLHPRDRPAGEVSPTDGAAATCEW